MTDAQRRFIADVLRNAHVQRLMDRWPAFKLPDGWLVGGCLFQTVWNIVGGKPVQAGIADYDIFYFDASDLSAESEAGMQSRVRDLLDDDRIVVEVKNQARVHTWYEAAFGVRCAPLRSAREGIDRFLVASTAVGMRPDGAGCEVYAPNGLEDLYAGRLTRNPRTPHEALFREKVASYRERWGWLRVG